MIRNSYLTFIFLLLTSFAFAQTATLKGRVIDAGTNTPLQGASIHFDDYKNGVVTNEKGEYIFTNITPGDYKLKVKYVGFEEFELKLKLKPGQVMSLDISLKSKTEALTGVNVFGKIDKESEAAGRTSEKNANNIINVVTAKVMERSPDVNAADVLSRVSGVTIQRNTGGGEAYAMIRGLEPRYNNTLINGVKVTSPDSKSRYVSLDVVPSDLLQRIEVSKTLLPEMEGDAIGGTVNLVFKEAPDTMLFKVNTQVGYNQIFLDRKFVDFSKSGINSQSPSQIHGDGYNAQPNDFDRSNLDFQNKTALPSSIVGLTYGNRFLKGRLGILVADNFQNLYYGTDAQVNPVAPDPHNGYKPGITDVANNTYSNQQLNNGLTLHADYKIDDHNQLLLTNVLLYSYLAQARLSIDTGIVGGNGGRFGPGTGTVSEDERSVVQKELLENLKLEGKHILSKHLYFDWAGVFSTATRRVPDEADISINHLVNPDFTSTADYFDGITHTWMHNNDRDISGLANFTYKAKVGDNPLMIKIGGLYRHKDRYNVEDYYLLRPLAGPKGGKQQFINIYSAQDTVYTPKGTADYDVNNYTAFEDVGAAYAEFKITLDKLDIFGGVRAEHTLQGFDYATFIPSYENDVRKSYLDILPSIQLNYKFSDKTQLRASYFSSISRPNYFELVPNQNDAFNGDSYMGNPALKHATADNFDLRYEIYPHEDEEILISGFYKIIHNPIEQSIPAFGGSNFVIEPVNIADKAAVTGFELVYVKYFGNIGASVNYAYTYSHVNAPKPLADTVDANNQTIFKNQSRTLQGQTPHSLNASLLYRDKWHGIFVQLAYQYLSKTLSQVYTDYGFDYYTLAQSFLALSAEKTLNKHFVIFGKFNNLLNTPTTIEINNDIVGHNIYKASYNLGVRYIL